MKNDLLMFRAGIGSKTNLRIGKYGEKVAALYLKRQGFKILATNLRLKRGEIDILAFKNNIIHIVEVKTARSFSAHRPKSHESNVFKNAKNEPGFESMLPEENFTKNKLRKLKLLALELPFHVKTITSNLKNAPIQIDGIAIRLFFKAKPVIMPTRAEFAMPVLVHLSEPVYETPAGGGTVDCGVEELERAEHCKEWHAAQPIDQHIEQQAKPGIERIILKYLPFL